MKEKNLLSSLLMVAVVVVLSIAAFAMTSVPAVQTMLGVLILGAGVAAAIEMSRFIGGSSAQ